MALSSQYATVIPHGKQRDDTPDWCDMHINVVYQYAVHWEAIGAELGLEHFEIANITENHPNRIENRCAAMLRKWLEKGTSPTWGTLDDAINTVGDTVSHEFSCNFKERYIATRFTVEHDAWPPEQPKEYTTLALIHHKNQPTQHQIFALAKQKATGKVDNIVAATRGNGDQFNLDDQDSKALTECLQERKCTHNLADILAPLENPDKEQQRTVLIEGAPGLGKTVLLRQIAYEWARDKQLIKSRLVFLLLLRDPTVREMSSVTDLVQYFSTESTEACKIHADNIISKTNGKSVTFLLDGYDELPAQKRKGSFIANIIQHKILPLSAVIVSSRPHASTALRNNALCQVDILGFSKDDQILFFQTALKDQPGKLQHLLSYLEDHPIISSLCFIPFIMTVLLWLLKQGFTLPNNSTELYNHFICHTIHHHLVKDDHVKDDASSNNFTDLNSLPQPYKKIIQELSVLCLKALENNDLVFTLQDIKKYCPEIDTFPGAINGFGLLQAVEHYSQDPTLIGKTKTLNFIHFSIQEYLAAYQITCLPPNEELQFIKTNFFSEFYSNTFALYVGLTRGQRPCFKKFLSSYGKNFISSFFSLNTNKIATKFLEDDRKSLRLFQCFQEADDQESCNSITDKIHSSKVINLQEDNKTMTPLLPSDIHCLALFLSRSPNMQLKTLNSLLCHIGDAGLRILHQPLVNSSITIDKINLCNNSLTSQSSEIVCEIATSCKTTKLNIANNKFTDGLDLSNNSTLELLIIDKNDMSSSGASKLFVALRNNKDTKLRSLHINNNQIDDETVSDITQFLMENNTLTELSILNNRLSGRGILTILKSLYHNNTLTNLNIGLWLIKENADMIAEREQLLIGKLNSRYIV